MIYHEQDVAQVPANFEVIVPTAELLMAAKAPVKVKDVGELDVAIAVEGAHVTLKSAITAECEAVEGKFPDYQRVIPPMANRKPSELHVNAAYMVDYLKLGQALGQRMVGISVSTNGESNAIVVDVGDNCAMCVIMPMRTGADFTDREWLASPATAKATAKATA